MVRAAIVGLILAVCVAPGNAATIMFDQFDHTGSAPVDYSVALLLEDAPNDDVFTITVMVDPASPNIADIVAVYLDVDHDPVAGFAASDFTSVSGGPITGFALDTSNVQAGNIGQIFDVGLAIGKTGLKGGRDDFQSTVFTVARHGLALDDWVGFGIRANSVAPWGTPDDQREQSAKEVGTTITSGGPGGGDPIPAPAALAAAGILLGLAAARRRPRVRPF